MREVLRAVVTGAVTRATRDAELNGLRIKTGQYLGLLEDEAVAAADDFDTVADAVVERLLAEPRDVLTLLAGEDEPQLDRLVQERRERDAGVRPRGRSGR